MSVAAIVLAAGASRRLGQPKQAAMVGGETLLQHAVRVARQAGLEPILVVVRDLTMAQGLDDCEVVANPLAEEGIASSIRCGVERARAEAAAGAVLMSCDQVALRPEHLRQLCARTDQLTGSGYAGKVGIPAYFPAQYFADLLTLQGDMGARKLLLGAAAVADEALELDVDTAADLERAREWMQAQR